MIEPTRPTIGLAEDRNMIRSIVVVLVLFCMGASFAEQDSLQAASKVSPSKLLIHLDLSWSTGEHRETRVLLPDGEEATLLFPGNSKEEAGSLAALHVIAQSLTDGRIQLQFDWSTGVDSEPRAFVVIAPLGETASLITGRHEGETIALGVLAEFASAELVAKASQCDRSSLSYGGPGATRSGDCSYQSCNGAWMYCCGVAACCNQGCGWFGNCGQVP